jgi:UDP-glucose:(heptosyl)LPS alpha-1,3-glucosyltransferase
MRKPRLAVVSPFIDKRHGTERRVAEWISRLGEDFEIHVYSQRVEDVDLGKITVHRIPKIPGPHLANFLWWFGANHLWRWWDRRIRGLNHDLVFTPGINCFDADAISAHIVFAEFYRQIQPELRFHSNSVWFWPRLLHRRLYYGLIMFLERKIYRNPRTSLILIARKTGAVLERLYGRNGNLPVVYIGLDHAKFNPEVRQRLRVKAREQLGLGDDRFVLLVIGNDWKQKGLPTLLGALQRLGDLPVCLLVVGKDDPLPYRRRLREYGLEERVRFLPPRPDVEFYYASADAYVGPSLEDTFAQPPAEAMACGLPVITSITNGTAEIINDGVDGLILREPANAEDLAAKIRMLWTETELRSRLGRQAAKTAEQYTWDRNGREIRAILQGVLRSKVVNKR